MCVYIYKGFFLVCSFKRAHRCTKGDPKFKSFILTIDELASFNLVFRIGDGLGIRGLYMGLCNSHGESQVLYIKLRSYFNRL